MPHTTLPSHCFRRRELHDLINRAYQLASQSRGELAASLTALSGAAATLDGQLAELGEDEPTRRRYPEVFADPHGWSYQWVASHWAAHVAGGPPVVVAIAQQILSKPPSQYVGTGRYRLTLGDRTHALGHPAEVRPLIADYAATIPGLPAGLRDNLMAFAGAV